MRKKVFDAVVAAGSSVTTPDMSMNAYQLLIVPGVGGTMTVERFNTRDIAGAVIDHQPVNAQDGTTPMTAIAAAATVVQRTGVVPYPGCTGFRVSAATAAGRVVIYGVE